MADFAYTCLERSSTSNWVHTHPRTIAVTVVVAVAFAALIGVSHTASLVGPTAAEAIMLGAGGLTMSALIVLKKLNRYESEKSYVQFDAALYEDTQYAKSPVSSPAPAREKQTTNNERKESISGSLSEYYDFTKNPAYEEE